jgi:molybdopterin molybdotransferase
MISVSEAKQLIRINYLQPEVLIMDLYEATGMILSEGIYSPSDSPPFNQSAMDGYAYTFSERQEDLIVRGEVAAGDVVKSISEKRSAVRIFTGAEVPSEFDSVVMQEKVEFHSDKLIIKDPDQKLGMNIRLKGSQILKGSLAVKAGKSVSPGLAGFLAGIGINKIKVYKTPRVSIISTGNELIAPGEVVSPGKVYECNSYSLNAALYEVGIKPRIYKVLDDEKQIIEAVKNSLFDSDLIILSGGVSVGDYDFVSKALEACEVKCIFHKVKQKPGKPLYFGRKDKQLVFGLPGNPAALLTCYYEYILPVIKYIKGIKETETSNLKLALTEAYTKKPGLTHFLKGKMNGSEVTILKAQESYLMSSFAAADCLVQLDEEKSSFQKGDLVEVQVLK